MLYFLMILIAFGVIDSDRAEQLLTEQEEVEQMTLVMERNKKEILIQTANSILEGIEAEEINKKEFPKIPGISEKLKANWLCSRKTGKIVIKNGRPTILCRE